MAKIKYKVLENKKVGTHSFYAVPVPHGTLSFDEVIREACQNTDIESCVMGDNEILVDEVFYFRPDVGEIRGIDNIA